MNVVYLDGSFSSRVRLGIRSMRWLLASNIFNPTNDVNVTKDKSILFPCLGMTWLSKSLFWCLLGPIIVATFC